MRQLLTTVSVLSDAALLAEVKVATAREREATVRLIALLAQMDARRLYLGEGCSSLHVLHAGAAPLGARRLLTDRGRARRAPLPGHPRFVERRLDDLDDRHAAGAAPHARESGRDPGCRASHEQARGRAYRGEAAPAAGATSNRPQASRAETRACSRSAIGRSADGARRFRSEPCAPSSTASRHSDAAGTGALQGTVHDVVGDARQAAPRAGSAAALNPERRIPPPSSIERCRYCWAISSGRSSPRRLARARLVHQRPARVTFLLLSGERSGSVTAVSAPSLAQRLAARSVAFSSSTTCARSGRRRDRRRESRAPLPGAQSARGREVVW